MKYIFLVVCSLLIGIVNAQAATNYCNDSNMGAAYKFNETSGNALDCTSHANDCTVTNVTQNATGKYGAAANFTQINNAGMNCGSGASIDNFIAHSGGAWVNATTDGNNDVNNCTAGVVMTKGSDAIRNWIFCISPTDKLDYMRRWGDTNHWITTSSVIQYGSFHHWAFTYDGNSSSNQALIYYDGVAQATNSRTPTGSITDDSSSSLHIGVNDGDDGNEFDGVIDEAFYYNGVLTSTQINEIMNSGLDGTQGSHTNIIKNATIRNATIQ